MGKKAESIAPISEKSTEQGGSLFIDYEVNGEDCGGIWDDSEWQRIIRKNTLPEER